MKTFIRKIIPNLKTFYDWSPKRFWILIALASITMILTMLFISYWISRDFFINVTLNFIVTFIGMIVTFIFFERRMDKIREKIDGQRNNSILDRLHHIEILLTSLDNDLKLLKEITAQEANKINQYTKKHRRIKKRFRLNKKKRV